MAYAVLARKYRSWTFDEIVGQEAIAKTLRNAIVSGRIHHAYLFTGTRGIGKTSMARIFARALNCLERPGPSVDPCRTCESCKAIAEGQDIDVIEIDAASHTGVDNIRELRANAIYRPARARYKVYIIDEVHMLSTGAFNALLKTLEEPPEHVKFILATTDPQKVPATIISRCQRFDFRTIGPEALAGHFRRIIEAEGYEADEAVIRRVARLANGSMRDGLSILDQLMSLSPGRLSMELLEEVLPTPHDQLLAALIDSWAARDAARAIEAFDRCLAEGYSLERFCDAMIDQLRTLMLLAVCGPDTPLVDLPGQFRDEVATRSRKFDAAAYVHMIALFEDLRRNVRFSQAGRALAEAVVVRLAEAVPYASLARLLERIEGATGEPVSIPAADKKKAPAGMSPPPDAPVLPAASAGTAPQGTHRVSDVAPAGPTRTQVRASSTAATSVEAGPGDEAAGSATVPPATGTRSKPLAGTPASNGSARTPRAPRAVRAPAPDAPPIPTRRVNSQEMKQAVSDALVRKVLDLFEGSLVNVERIDAPPASSGPSAAPEAAPSA